MGLQRLTLMTPKSGLPTLPSHLKDVRWYSAVSNEPTESRRTSKTKKSARNNRTSKQPVVIVTRKRLSNLKLKPKNRPSVQKNKKLKSQVQELEAEVKTMKKLMLEL